jgi:HD-GYP domain-containing protein (c-di-GMP phosphodiesterase class II)
MVEINFGNQDTNIETVKNKLMELSLLAKGDGIEIMTYKYNRGVVFHVDPSEDGSILEFFYVLSGSIIWQNEREEKIINGGEYFYVHNLEDSTHFKTLTETMVLYVSSQPVFHLLSNEIEKMMEILKRVEEKDMYTHGHGMRLQEYSFKIGEKMHLSRNRLDVLSRAAAFHDIGKINVPDCILKKPGKLSPEEFNVIKRHPEDGEQIIKNSFLKEAALAIRQHHERLDGSGYPDGLKSDEICLEAKIIAVSDSYDAMTSDRPYRKGLDPRTALGEIKGLIGKHYDEKVVLCLEEILQEDGII